MLDEMETELHRFHYNLVKNNLITNIQTQFKMIPHIKTGTTMSYLQGVQL